MSGQTPPTLSYAIPTEKSERSFIKAIGIIGICVGSLQFTGDGLELSFLLADRLRIGHFHTDDLLSTEAFFLFFILAGALIVISIACLKRKPSARIWMIRYAIAYLMACGLDLLLPPLIKTLPALLRFGEVLDPQVLDRLLRDAEGNLIIDLFTGSLPVVILIYMTRPKVRVHFSG